MPSVWNSMAALAAATWVCAGCDLPNGGRWPQEGVASINDARPAAQPVQAEGLSLTLATERPDYELGEPVYALIILENRGERARRVFGKLRPEDGAVTLLVAAGDSEARPFRPLGHADSDDTAWVDLPPGERIGATAPVFFGSDGWTFAEPGEYRLTAVYTLRGDGESVEYARSEPATLTIRASEDAGPLLTAGDSASLQAGKFMTWQAGDHLTAGRQLLNDLIERLPASLQASHAAFALGRSWSEPFMDYRMNEVRPPDCERALDFLDGVDPAVVGTQANVLLHIARARCAAAAGDRASALDYLEQARELVAERPELAGLRARIDEYSENLGSVGRS